MTKQFVQTEHYGKLVWANEESVGKNRELCLCYSCANFNPGAPETNCPIANLVYATAIATGITSPVLECPDFVEDVE